MARDEIVGCVKLKKISTTRVLKKKTPKKIVLQIFSCVRNFVLVLDGR